MRALMNPPGGEKITGFAPDQVGDDVLREGDLLADFILRQHIQPPVVVAVDADDMPGGGHFANLRVRQVTRFVHFGGGEENNPWLPYFCSKGSTVS